jgi:hypothetical protein
MKSGKQVLVAAAATMALVACAPATAFGVVAVNVTGDDGNQAPLSTAAPLGIRNMDVKTITHVDVADAAGYTTTVVGPDGPGAATAHGCEDAQFSPEDSNFITYRGNGLYKLTLSLFSDRNCTTAKGAPTAYSWTVNASVAIGQPASPLMTRAANSFSTNTQQLDFNQNPGAVIYEIKYALGGVVGADGAISSAARRTEAANRVSSPP